MAKTGWESNTGTNASNFNALAVGFFSNGVYDGKGTDAVFLTTSILPDYNVPDALISISRMEKRMLSLQISLAQLMKEVL
ncbi:hypothetical protein SNE25_00555 [Mucilaginibacter sabulilitoris]|uniref:Uncharacterized protein n=1 Tax=Mucilaginibacter sabulilitoris TaxID=1173583 RepID=A0ABZ0TS87_9SPHI|nr:hypothetical protein [Mucilaginibacter sabulilitoris]WPU94015.1 hypothetical protein SNE25_00555 [Mucilaginibacter sabulilitoris]